MNSYLLIQLLISFIVGGALITVLSFLAERVNKNIAGIILMFPSTIVLGFFFLGLTTSAAYVSYIIPATLIPLGIVIFSSIVYIYLALFFSKYFKSKISQILVTLFASTIIWFLLAAPFAFWRFKNLLLGIVGFLGLFILSYLILNGKKEAEEIARPKYTKTQIILRAIYSGTINSIIVLLGKTLGPFWGGIFTMYPAATFATLMIFNFYYEPKQLFYFYKNAPVGSLSLFIYTITVMIFFPIVGFILGTVISYLISLLFSICLIKYKNRTMPS